MKRKYDGSNETKRRVVLSHLLHGDGHNCVCLNGSAHAIRTEDHDKVTCPACIKVMNRVCGCTVYEMTVGKGCRKCRSKKYQSMIAQKIGDAQARQT